ncbi:hypothetical protein KM915_10320 [Cytobacillus oceanisediminis]|uniref:hypothetical protein n=1 Tax=Cytobacillus oceanisediminis TaxID=665099 RepID=UPI001C21E1FC|nr:hypothetical protein [Cytobacillus oceanisediminis]MBU8730448.1 hypothetical protein [Cytobacillus oceanisediminis]
MNSSDHPKYSIENARDYEIKEAYKEFESEAKRLQAEWAQERANMQADADRRAARASVFVSDKDKQTAEQIGNRILASINSVRNKEDLRAAVHRAANDINYLTDPEKTALQMKMGDIVDSVRAQAKRYGSTSVTPVTILDSLRDIRNEDLLSRDVANQLPQNVDIEYMQSRAVSKAPKSKIGQVE